MHLSPWFGFVTEDGSTAIFCFKCRIWVARCSGHGAGLTHNVRTACGEHDAEFHPNDPLEF